MKGFGTYIIIPCLLAVLSVTGCVREQFRQGSIGEGEAIADFSFSHRDFKEVAISTRASLGIVPESRVSNMFVFIFVNGTRYYSHYFDKEDMMSEEALVKASSSNCWFVAQQTSESEPATHGTIRIKAPQLSGGTMYLIANIDADMVNISPEKLNMITTENELLSLEATMNQKTLSRNGLFPMTSKVSNIDIDLSGIKSGGSDVTAELERLDAKVQVNVKVAEGNLTTSGDTSQVLKEFKPESWKVVNVPEGCRVFGQETDAESGYFSTEAIGFESSGQDDDGNHIDGFSFYMLENRESGNKKASAGNYHDRDRRKKNPVTGEYDTTDGLWKNAPEDATYLVIKGEVVMDVNVSSEAKNQQLAAEVTYYVHLGDFKTSPDNYDVNRNTFYTYTITIKGVNSIEVEVSTSNPDGGTASPGDVIEKESGATGQVYVAKESIYTFDAHYGQRVFCFDAAYIDPETVTWYVKTPFGKEGIPDKVADTEIPSGMDYKWVHFLVNRQASSREYQYAGKTYTLDEYPYSHNNMAYPGDSSEELMDVVQFTKYMKEQKRALDAGRANDFRKEFDEDWMAWYNGQNPDEEVSDPAGNPDGVWFRDRIYVTVFVDEFFYESDPISGETRQDLWKEFVNQPNRLMHVLCDNSKSLDRESSATGSVITIRQRSIQTVYDTNKPELMSAWGCETVDENAESFLWFFETGETMSTGPSSYPSLGNNSIYNGLFNTARLWGSVEGNTWNDVRWDDYLDYDRPNDYTPEGGYNIIFLKDDKAVFRYSAMMRNRDNNGNGIIDPDELRWYTASIGQLEFLYFGELGLNADAKLYPSQYSSEPQGSKFDTGHPYSGADKWRCHVISSTITSSKPQILWAEEGLSISEYRQDIGWGQSAPYSVKCVRNLGFKTDTPDAFMTDDDDHRPTNIIDVYGPEAGDNTATSDTQYKFNISNLNDKSIRSFKTSIELEPSDENNEISRLYKGFETGELLTSATYGYDDLYTLLTSGGSHCPSGYRMPNIREAAVMYLLCDNTSWWVDSNKKIMTSSYYSLGYYGNQKNSSTKKSWNMNPVGNGNINLDNGSYYIRCVRDWDPE